MTQRVLEDLYYDAGVDWSPVPAWGSFFIALGSAVGNCPASETRQIAGVAIPTRTYAATLTALGIVISRSILTVNQGGANEYFQRLCGLEVGTPVSLLRGKRKLKGKLIGCKEFPGGARLGVQLHNREAGGATEYIASRDSLRIEVATSEINELPKKQTGQLVIPLNEFACFFLGKEQSGEFVMRSRLECVLLGRVNLIRQEIMETEFSCNAGRPGINNGILQDILRIRRFMGEGKAYRSDVYSVNSRSLPAIARNSAPHVTIFDGATGFLKWRDYWRESHWIVLLDRTEPGFEDAVMALNHEYSKKRTDDERTFLKRYRTSRGFDKCTE